MYTLVVYDTVIIKYIFLLTFWSINTEYQDKRVVCRAELSNIVVPSLLWQFYLNMNQFKNIHAQITMGN